MVIDECIVVRLVVQITNVIRL
jgi:hypothetical protein